MGFGRYNMMQLALFVQFLDNNVCTGICNIEVANVTTTSDNHKGESCVSLSALVRDSHVCRERDTYLGVTDEYIDP